MYLFYFMNKYKWHIHMYIYFIEPFFSILCMLFFCNQSTRLILCFSANSTINCYIVWVWIMLCIVGCLNVHDSLVYIALVLFTVMCVSLDNQLSLCYSSTGLHLNDKLLCFFVADEKKKNNKKNLLRIQYCVLDFFFLKTWLFFIVHWHMYMYNWHNTCT